MAIQFVVRKGLKNMGNVIVNYKIVSSGTSYTVSENDYLVECTVSTDVQIPTGTDVGKVYEIKNSSSGNVTIMCPFSKNMSFDGSPIYTVAPGKSVIIIHEGGSMYTDNWAVIINGSSGYSGTSGTSGYSGKSGYSGYSGIVGKSGYSGTSGSSGISGYSGYVGKSGYSGTNMAVAGTVGKSGYSGISGYSGYRGYSGYPEIYRMQVVSDVTNSTTTYATATGLQFTLLHETTYNVRGFIITNSSSASGDVKWRFNNGVDDEYCFWYVNSYSIPPAGTAFSDIRNYRDGISVTSAERQVLSTSAGLGIVFINCAIENPNQTNFTIRLEFALVSASGTATIKAGSYLEFERVS
jgi:hypothetical protein